MTTRIAMDTQTCAAEAHAMADNAVNQKFGSRSFHTESSAGRFWQMVYESSLRALLATYKEEN